MKHIKTINELLKSTYKSASDKLKTLHPSRSEELMKHADTSGGSEFSKFNKDRDFPYPFEFKNVDLQDVKEHLLGKFYITDGEQRYGLRPGYSSVIIHMLNDWGQNVAIQLTHDGDNYMNLKIFFGNVVNNELPQYHRDFLFDNRKDALAFKKYLKEKYDNDELEFMKDPLEFSINKFYSTK